MAAPMYGTRGPVPKRSSEVMGHRGDDDPRDDVETITLPDAVVAPEPPPNLHPLAEQLIAAAMASGQAKFYEPSDWAILMLVAESLSRDLKPQVVGVNENGEAVMAKIPFKGASLSAYLKAFSSLMLTEGDRRRMRVEIERGAKPHLAAVVPISDQYADALA